MTTQASVVISFHDDPEFCHNLDKTDVCHYYHKGHCVLRVVDPKAVIELDKFLLLRIKGRETLKDPNCKFIWEKSKKDK